MFRDAAIKRITVDFQRNGEEFKVFYPLPVYFTIKASNTISHKGSVVKRTIFHPHFQQAKM